MKEVLCISCGNRAAIEKECGDNGSSYNGCQYRLECMVCGKKTQFYKSQMTAISEWEKINQTGG